MGKPSLSLAIAGALLGAAGCTGSHVSTTDAGVVAHGCGDDVEEGARCDFVMPCTRIWDFYMGRCGEEEWTCVDGRVAYDDRTFACSPPDAGRDAPPFDAGPRTWCPGYVAPPAATATECRTDADCLGGTCWAPGDTAPLHGGGACSHDCASDPDCPSGAVCERYNGGFCEICVPTCTPGSCGLWESCGSDGHCEPASCLDGSYLCPPGSSCGLTGTPADLHGCALAGCVSDADCGCGACVEGACALGAGRCDLPRP